MEVLDNKYRIENVKLGSGSFSEVFLGTNIITFQKVAIKKISLQKKNNFVEKLHHEIELMKKLDHPNIVKYYDVVKTDTHWYIIMEYCNAGTLNDVIKYHETENKVSDFNREASTFYYMNQLKEALHYIRQQDYIHRDIKPFNVLITDTVKETMGSSLDESGLDLIFKYNEQSDSGVFSGNIYSPNKLNSSDKKNIDYSRHLTVKLADFGLAKRYIDDDNCLLNTICGSPLYMAPELLINMEYNSSVDLWSFGIIMYEMLFGYHPTSASSLKQLKKNLQNNEINFHYNEKFTILCFDILMKLLTKNHKTRITWNNFYNHEWFVHWKNINSKDSDVFTHYEKNLSPHIDTDTDTDIDTDTQQNRYASSAPPAITNLSMLKIRHNDNLEHDKYSIHGIQNFSKSEIIGIDIKPKSSNLTKMFLGNYNPHPVNQINYSDYPSSYPPNKRKSVFYKMSITPLKETNT